MHHHFWLLILFFIPNVLGFIPLRSLVTLEKDVVIIKNHCYIPESLSGFSLLLHRGLVIWLEYKFATGIGLQRDFPHGSAK
jgi:hypothetical protein